MAEIPVVREGAALDWIAASSGGDTLPNPDGRTRLFVLISVGQPAKVLTAKSVSDCSHRHGATAGALIDRPHDLPSTPTVLANVMLPGFQQRRFNDESGHVAIELDDAAGIALAGVRI